MPPNYTKRKCVKALSPIQSILSVITLLFLLTACNDKPKEKLPYEHSVENMPEPVSSESSTEKNNSSNETKESNHTTQHYTKGENHFSLGNKEGIFHSVSIENDQLLFEKISQPIVVLNFFSTWSLPCQGEAPYLADLQKKYPKEVFVAGILIHPDDHLNELESFIQQYHADYFISSSSDNDRFTQKVLEELHMPEILPIPLTVIYHSGHYYRHYEGAVPIEMIEHDIKALLEE